jgi:hypothetical protein
MYSSTVRPRSRASSAVTILDLGARLVASKELGLGHQRRVAGPLGDLNEILVRGDGAVDQHHRCRRVAVLADQQPTEVEQHDDEVLVDYAFRPETVNEE